MRSLSCLAASLSLAALFLSPSASEAQVTAVPNALNFQGRFANPSGNPVPDGTYSVRFSLHDALTGGTEKYSKTVANVQVKNGTFAVTLDSYTAGTFNGNLWLEIKIGEDAALTPRTPVVSVPYAMKSDLALTVPDGSLTTSKFASGLFNSTAWLLGGNSGTNPATQFIGTTDNQRLVFKTNNQRGLQLQYVVGDIGATGINVLGGHWNNVIGTNAGAATVFGGSNFNAGVNSVFDSGGTVSGGEKNTAGSNNNIADALDATVGGGYNNTASGQAATIPGGESNTASGDFSFAAGLRAKAIHAGTFVWADATIDEFSSTGNNQFLIRAAGGVGIGTPSPGARLHIVDSNWPSTIVESNSPVGAWLSLRNTSTGGHNWNVISSGSGNGEGPGKLLFNDQTTGATRMLIDANGNVGIGTFSPVYRLHVNGSVAGVGAYNNLSDARYKTHVQTFPEALDAILNLRGVTFDWRQSEYPEMNFDKGRQIGFLAQEVEKVLPQVVTTAANGYKSVAYANIVPVAVEAIKALKKENDAVKADNAELRLMLKALSERVNALEAGQRK